MSMSTPDSTPVNPWTKNIWTKQALKLIFLRLNQKMHSVLGKVVVQVKRSMRDSMARKKYIGRCKDSSWWMRYTRPRFPKREMIYIAQNGMEIHTCTLSRPGIPLRIKDLGATYKLLENSITNSVELYFSRSLYPEEKEWRNRNLIQIILEVVNVNSEQNYIYNSTNNLE